MGKMVGRQFPAGAQSASDTESRPGTARLLAARFDLGMSARRELVRKSGCFDFGGHHKAAVVEWPLMAGSSHREPPCDSPLPDTLLTLIAPDPMRTTRAKGCILGGEHESPKGYGRGHGKWAAEANRNRCRVWVGIAGAVEPESVAGISGMRTLRRDGGVFEL